MLYIFIMASFLKKSNNINNKGEKPKIITIKKMATKSGLMLKVKKSCLHVWFISWVVIYRYIILKKTGMLILGSMHRFGFNLMCGGQKMGILTVF